MTEIQIQCEQDLEDVVAKLKTLHGEGIRTPVEMFEFLNVLEFGAKKYPANNWLEADGIRSDHMSMHDSMFHHLAESLIGITKDIESGLHPLAHLQCRGGMVQAIQVLKIRETRND